MKVFLILGDFFKKMLQNIPSEITITSFSFVGLLTGYIWNAQEKKIKEIREVQKLRPCNVIHLKITEIQTDIKWIKQKLKK